MHEGEAIIVDMQRQAWRYAALRALVAAGVPEQLADGPRTVDSLATSCGADPVTLNRLLRVVAQTPLINSVPPSSYELTPLGMALVEGRSAMELRYNADPEIWGALGELPSTLRTGMPPFEERHGNLYAYLAARPELSATFDGFMNVLHQPLAAALPAAGEFSGDETIVDVGGGDGTFLAAILRSFPAARGVLLDLDRTIPVAASNLAGLLDRVSLVAGDFFTSVPSGGDVYLVSHVLHNWHDKQAITILRSIRSAIASSGRLFVVEIPLPDGDTPHFAKDVEVRLMSLHAGGQERTEAEYAALMSAADFRLDSATPLTPAATLLTARPV
jgi:hypothetical protein